MSLKDKRILALVHEDFEDSELIYPIYRLAEEGIRVTLAGEKAKEPYHGKYGIPVVSDLAYGEVDPADYDGLVIEEGPRPDPEVSLALNIVTTWMIIVSPSPRPAMPAG